MSCEIIKTFNVLPLEVVASCGFYLPLQDLVNFRKACVKFRRIFDQLMAHQAVGLELRNQHSILRLYGNVNWDVNFFIRLTSPKVARIIRGFFAIPLDRRFFLWYFGDGRDGIKNWLCEVQKVFGLSLLQSEFNTLHSHPILWITLFNNSEDRGTPLLSEVPELRNTKEVVLAAVQRDAFALEYASQELRNNKEVVLAAIRQCGLALRYASSRFQDDPGIVLAAIQRDARALEFASPGLRNNLDIVLATVRRNGLALEYASRGREGLNGNKEVVLAAVQQNGLAFENADWSLRNDAEVALAAVQQNGLALQYVRYDRYVGPDLRDDPKTVLAAVQQNGLALQYASWGLRYNLDIVLAAVQQNGLALKYASSELQNNQDIVLAAVQQNGLALKYASPELQKEFALTPETASLA